MHIFATTSDLRMQFNTSDVSIGVGKVIAVTLTLI